MAKTLTCETCGKQFQHATTGRPKYCPTHRPTKNRARDVKRLAGREGEAGARKVLADAGVAPEENEAAAGLRALRVQRLAVALGAVGGDLSAAAALVGLAEDPELELLEQAARERTSLVEARSTELGGALDRAMLLMALRLQAEAHVLPRAQLPAAVKALAQVKDGLGLGSQTWASVEVVLRGPEAPPGG